MHLVFTDAKGISTLAEVIDDLGLDQVVKLEDGTVVWECGEWWEDKLGNKYVCVWGLGQEALPLLSPLFIGAGCGARE